MGFTEFYRVFLNGVGFKWVTVGSNNVLPSKTGFYLGFNKFYRVLMGLLGFTGFLN